MSDSTPNLRRNQIMAARIQAKTLREFQPYVLTAEELWALVNTALEENSHTRMYMGHLDRARSGTKAQMAARELKLRGTQLQLPA